MKSILTLKIIGLSLLLFSPKAQGAYLADCYRVTDFGIELKLIENDPNAAAFNQDCLEAAIELSPLHEGVDFNSRPLLIPAGRYYHDDTIWLRSHLQIDGAGSGNSILIMSAGQNKSQIATGQNAHVSAWSISNLALSGNKDNQPILGENAPILIDINNAATKMNEFNDLRSVDAIGVMENVRIFDCPGTCMRLAGRGENLLSHVTISRGGFDGLRLDSFDNHFETLVVNTVARHGVVITKGNNRFIGGKIFFTGLGGGDGNGVKISGAGVEAIQLIGLSIQDTLAPALSLMGRGHVIKVEIDGVGTIGRAYAKSTAPLPNLAAVVIDNCQYCALELMLRDAQNFNAPDPSLARNIAYYLSIKGANIGTALWRIMALEKDGQAFSSSSRINVIGTGPSIMPTINGVTP